MAVVLTHTHDGDDELAVGLFQTDKSAADLAVIYREYLRLRELAFERSAKESEEYPSFADWCQRAAVNCTEVEYEEIDMFSGEVQ